MVQIFEKKINVCFGPASEGICAVAALCAVERMLPSLPCFKAMVLRLAIRANESANLAFLFAPRYQQVAGILAELTLDNA